jgi:hypothetical protein
VTPDRIGRRAAGVFPLLAAVLGAGGIASFASRSAHATLIFELAPSTGLGGTTNADATVVPIGDMLFRFSNVADLRYEGARSHLTAGYRLALTRLLESGTNLTTNELFASSAFTLSPFWDLNLGAAGAISTTSRLEVRDPTTTTPQPTPSGNLIYLASGATENLIFAPTPSWRFVQTLAGSRIDYLTAAPVPDSLALTAGLRVDLVSLPSSFSIDARITDFYLKGTPAMAIGPFTQGHNYLAQVLFGWNRELSARWAGELQLGPAAMFRAGGPMIVIPGAVATLRYRQQTWFANLAVSQVTTANMFAGVATVNDQAVLRVGLPLTRNEQTVLAGTASYAYGRTGTQDGDLVRAFDVWMVGASLSRRLGRTPLLASLQYSVLNQRGTADQGGQIPTLIRQTLMLSLTGLFTWGPAPPPEFGGAAL